MSDENNSTTGNKADEVAPADTGKDEAAASEQGDTPGKQGSPLVEKSAASATPPAPVVKKGSSLVAWLALVLVLVLAAAAGWTVQQGMQREAALVQRIESLGTELAPPEVDLDGLERKLRQQIDRKSKQSSDAISQQNAQLDQLRAQIRDQQERLASFSANDHDAWLRAEAQYLLRLASQRLIMARDVVSAQALLGSADSILDELNDPTLYDVRAAVASEQAALRAVPKVDVEGIYLSLSALIEQADSLVIFQMQETEAQPEAEPTEGWQSRLARGYEEAAQKLSDYVVIRRRDVPMRALMDPQWEGLVRQNLRMLLEQAQVALLSGNQTLYTESLQRSLHWVEQFYDSDEAAAKAMAREIRQLEQRTVQVTMPDLTRSLKALDKAMKEAIGQGEAG
ncbi:hypothetical protein GCM10007052_23820 [Halioglobus japonicus]|uniref:Uroporphyrinogen III n=1 Tax=Halioglobus japonicus TaxID=930805 RepID=A0AAP8MDE3_9GAMM|nr:uroporphyrinogen-III C-methyltransferase [Halioglobus japonicus]PLW85765.1 uroporphyrinogen III [Halioglobus japonicus]GHD17392.1 hypothetical protein GCM10007052_23820 [Halioglobus japonicus]